VHEPLINDRLIELLLRNHASYVPTFWLIAWEENTAAVRSNLKRIVDARTCADRTDIFCGFSEFGEIARNRRLGDAPAFRPPENSQYRDQRGGATS
jgi:hypothetical protein